MMKRIVNVGICASKCFCMQLSGADPDQVGYPPYHPGCDCYVEEISKPQKTILRQSSPQPQSVYRPPPQLSIEVSLPDSKKRAKLNNIDSAMEELYRLEAEYLQREAKTLSDIKTLHPVAFERFIASIFQYRGYKCQLTKRSNDKGVDIFISKGKIIGIVQCKRLKGSIGAPIIRDLYGSMLHHQAHEAYLVTPGIITIPAQEFAANKPIYLIDGEKLLEWMADYGSKLK